MRTVTLYKFDELLPEAKPKAIEEFREKLMQTQSPEALQWAIDDCSLFEPPHKEMAALLGEDYYDRNLTPDGKYGQFVFKNKRKGIMVDLESREICIADPLEITNESMFLKWLGIPEVMQDKVSWYIHDGTFGTLLVIEYADWVFDDETLLVDPDDPVFQAARNKFEANLESILDRIQSGYDEYFSDENISEMLSESNTEFSEDGTLIENSNNLNF
jgi:hypothetical protein